MSSFHTKAIILETNHSKFLEFNKLSTHFSSPLPLLTDKREAYLSISDKESKQENKVQIVRALGIKVQNPGFRTGHRLEKACNLE